MIDDIAIAGPIILACMGIVEALWSPAQKSWVKYVWVVLFVAIGALTFYATRASQSRIEAEITGGESYAYIHAMFPAGDPGPFRLAIYNPSGVSVRNVRVKIFRQGDPTSGRAAPEIPLGDINPRLTILDELSPLALGDYQINMYTHGGMLMEMLHLYEENGRPNQSCELVRVPSNKHLPC